MSPSERQTLLDAPGVAGALERIVQQVVEFAGGTERLVLVGIQRRGADLAQRLAHMIAARWGTAVPLGVMDITLYRDDLQTVGPRPIVGETRLPVDLDHRCVMIVDDVLYTGRTIRAAMDQLADFGRPARIGLCVLVDRGGRELPIQADIVGTKVDAHADDMVDVLVNELDGRDAVELVKGGKT
ncbi:MAG: bifunctional pyr operon transcriptional regulator/uracil phosphoribosyltransferase PyrR [Gemmatimonadales bacterium]|nr:bifunctional pyr operon transcriptional regulator/uracil phosphoribosyltransferase PyrR [Gemmatimonadales bacterium]NIN13047.1 bifunctional pyr operon transcriptional regulator/uracil phosphoribosyltransferase PyrR [Gemmatimonadales bacterium]NIN51131.1 bifunctional pyr operon transcriptional regulator/uracil phosphoribosyltransferase PyrR [Gemmatimonadales bacterium]NIP08595.1 bifunctional pyr operon transcriptional regulator/uracil phosphoribosyltransferase PyrR [Gemmatimonadales bacterium]